MGIIFVIVGAITLGYQCGYGGHRELLTLEEVALDILTPGYLLRTYDQFAHRRWTHPLHSPSEASSLQALWESFLF